MIYVCARDTTLIYISIIRFKGLIIIKLKRWLLANVQIKLLPVKYWNYFCCEMFGELSHWMRWSQIIFFGKFKLGHNKCFRIGCHKNRHNFVNIGPTILVRYSWSVFIYQIRWQLQHCLSYRGCGCGHYVMKFPPVPFQLLDIIPNQPVYSDPEVAEALGCTVHSNCLTWSIRHQLIPASQEKLAYPPSDMK